MNKRLAVLGAGIAGVSAAYHGKKDGFEVVAYEAGNEIGGLVSNFTIDGFRFDKAIHLSFTKDEYVKNLFDQTPHLKHSPDSYCYDRGYWLKHPIQNNLHPLPLEEKISLIESFIQRPEVSPENYEQWLVAQYGSLIAQKYPLAYTKKYWGLDASQLSLEWIGNRVRKADIKEILAGALEQRCDNHYYANEMRYPKKGGYKAFIQPMIDEINVECNKRVTELDPTEKLIAFEDGSSELYDHLVNTIPLPAIVPLIKGVPDQVLEASQSLLYTRVDLISIGLNKPNIPPYLWFYIYGEECKPARGYSPSWKSPDNAPDGCSSLQFEIYSLNTSDLYSATDLKENVISHLVDMGICQPEDIIFTHHKHLPFGNVVFDHGMEERREIILDYLRSLDIESCGRFGEWGYLWSDQSLMSGKKAANKISSMYE